MQHKFSQTCFVTSDIDRIVDQWVELQGAGPFYEFPTPSEGWVLRGEKVTQNFRAMVGFCGPTQIEFVQPVGDGPSFFREWLDERGEGAVHHVYGSMHPLTTEEFDARSQAYEARGVPRTLHIDMPGLGRIAFFDARKEIGCYMELSQQSPELVGIGDRMYAAHLAGLQGRPIRPIGDVFEG